MLRAQKLAVTENVCLNNNTYKLVLRGEVPQDCRPGQFAEIRVPGFSLGRPLSLNGYTEDSLTFVYRVNGQGTQKLSEIRDGMLEVITGCGNGFTLKRNERVLVAGGGIGTAPLLPLIRELKENNCEAEVIFGFRTREEILFERELSGLGVSAHFAYDSEGENVVTKMKELGVSDVYFYACGPLPMMEALCRESTAEGQCSLETRMGCGFGACMGCSVRTVSGMARICKEGPVFAKKEILWQNLK